MWGMSQVVESSGAYGPMARAAHLCHESMGGVAEPGAHKVFLPHTRCACSSPGGLGDRVQPDIGSSFFGLDRL